MSNRYSSYTSPFLVVVFLQQMIQVLASCSNGAICQGNEYCCSSGCCYYSYTWSVWNMWYFWFILIFVLMSCFGGCGYWKRRQWMIHQHRAAQLHQQHPHLGMSQPGQVPMPVYPYTYENPYATTEPPQGTFPCPPAYNEVISKPDQYPANKLPPYNTAVMQNTDIAAAAPTGVASPVQPPPPYAALPVPVPSNGPVAPSNPAVPPSNPATTQ